MPYNANASSVIARLASQYTEMLSSADPLMKSASFFTDSGGSRSFSLMSCPSASRMLLSAGSSALDDRDQLVPTELLLPRRGALRAHARAARHVRVEEAGIAADRPARDVADAVDQRAHADGAAARRVECVEVVERHPDGQTRPAEERAEAVRLRDEEEHERRVHGVGGYAREREAGHLERVHGADRRADPAADGARVSPGRLDEADGLRHECGDDVI